ncbi:VWA domain-containing protein BatB [Leptospira sarikeiensis]|uniref:VWA domain-containing protein n=1 Tax=Leptospira sarikeiensis TaxID=2484943 RepID=A0A4R9K225_9LEPT|nr:VWA domain-containing protein [Leptospira sarikeiensis]TGL58884.1 VWA domain-containing protein [Leptospira sarikeiensis]
MSEVFLESFWIALGLIFFAYSLFKLVFYFYWNRWKKQYPGLPRESKVPPFYLATLRIVLLASVLTLSYFSYQQTEGEKSKEEEVSKGVDFLFLVDVSLSMQAVDTNPSRISRVKETILRLLPELNGNRFGMVVFAASPFVYCPMTSDTRAFSEYVRGLDVDIVGDRGTDLKSAFKKAEEVLNSNQVLRNRILVLISDGEDMDSPAIKKFPAEVWVWSVGTPTGGPIGYSEDGSRVYGFLTKDGSLAPYENSPGVIISRANPIFLNELASANGGRFLSLDSESPDIADVRSWMSSMEKNTGSRIRNLRKAESARKFLIPALLILLFDFFILEFLGKYLIRASKKLAPALLILLSLWGRETFSFELDPGGNRIKEGRNSYDQGDYKSSLEKYKEADPYFPEDPRLEFNRGDAEYKSGNIEKAIRHFEKATDSKNQELRAQSHFNLGNSYLKLGDRKKAAEHYLRSLKENPDLEAAKKNLEWLRKLPPPEGNQGSESQEGSEEKGSKSPDQKQGSKGKNKTDKQSKSGSEKENKNKNKSKAEDELDRIMESMDLDSVKRRSPGSRNKEVFW